MEKNLYQRWANGAIYMKLNKSIIKEWKAARKSLDKTENTIYKRVNQIVQLISRCFGLKKDVNWWFPNAEEGEVGTIEDIDDDLIELYGIEHSFDTRTWDYANGFESKFLFMNDADIIIQIAQEIEKYELEQDKKRKNRKMVSAKQKEKRKKVLSKLSKSEQKILGVEI